uniref:Helicase ARIP4 n=1 Tax=Panagrolaimus sp. ES5 TaxID=591445 RepID=A0AC34GQQ3_9BILA
MSDEDKMENVNEAFGMLLSIWTNYFDEDNPSIFFESTRSFVQNFVSKYDEAEASARSALPKKEPCQGETTSVHEDVSLPTSDNTLPQNENGSAMPDNSLHETSVGDSSFVTAQESFMSHCVTEDQHQQSDALIPFENLSTEASISAAIPRETSMLVDDSDALLSSPSADSTIMEFSESVNENLLSLNGLSEYDMKSSVGESHKPEILSAEPLNVNQEELVSSSNESILDTDTKPFIVATSFAVSRKRRYYFAAFEPTDDDDEDNETEPSVKKPRFSDLLLAPLNPQQSLFGSSAPQARLQLGNVMDNINQACTSSTSIVNEIVDNKESSENPINDVETVTGEVMSNSSDTVSPELSTLVTDNIEMPGVINVEPVETNICASDGYMTITNDELSLSPEPNFLNQTLDEFSSTFTNGTENEPVEDNVCESCDNVAVEDKGVVAEYETIPLSVTLNSDCIEPSTEYDPVSANTDELSLMAEADEPILPVPEMPSFFPSLFGRSVAPDLSPVESPEKFGGVYKTIFKDILVKNEPEEESLEEVMDMEIDSDEPIEAIASLSEPEMSVNSCCVDPLNEDTLVINNFVIDLLNKIPEDADLIEKFASGAGTEQSNEQQPFRNLVDEVIDQIPGSDCFDTDFTFASVEDFSEQHPSISMFNNVNTDDDHEAKLVDNNINDCVEDNDLNSDVNIENSLDDFSTPVENVSSENIPVCTLPVQDALVDELQDDVETPPVEEHVENNAEISESKHFADNIYNIDQDDNTTFEEVVENGQDDASAAFEAMSDSNQSVHTSPIQIANEIEIVEHDAISDAHDNENLESKPLINLKNDSVDDDETNIYEAVEDGRASAPLGKISAGNRSAYIPPVQDPDKFLVAGRQDGASFHYIPIFRQNSIELSQNDTQDEIVPFALRTPDGEIQELSGESKAAFKEAVNSIVSEDHRLSMQDVVKRHSRKTDEVIVLHSDGEDDFNQTAKEFILDADSSSDEPTPVKVHPSLTKILKKHQTEGISFLYKCLIGKITDLNKKDHTGAILAHCMGLGKTLQVIAFLHTVLTHPQLRKSIRRVLILCPAGVVLNWAAEFKKWLSELDKSLNTLKVYEVSRTQKDWATRNEILKKWAKGSASVVIMGYEMYRNSFKNSDPHILTSPGPDILVCDEAHILNSEKTQVFEAVRKTPTLRRISLTGTPIQNHLREYYQMVDFVTPGILGTLKDFQKKFIIPIAAASTKEADENDVEIMKKRASILWKQLGMVMNRQNFSVLSKILPEKKEHVIFIRLSELQLKLYEHYMSLRKSSTMLAQQRMFADEHTVYRIGTFPYLVKMYDKDKLGDWYSAILKTFNCKENTYETGNKLVLFMELLKSFEKLGEKTIVFTHSLENLDILVKMLESKAATWFSDNHCAQNANWSWKRDSDYFVIQGNTAPAKRHQMIQNFNDPKNKRCRLFFCSDAGSIGTNMTGGTRVIVFDSKHNPSKEVQAIFRSYRIGQTKPVHVYRLIAQGTMEDWILKRQIIKQQTAARVLDNEGITRTIERNDINELLRFHPAPKDIDFTAQTDYTPSGDEEFDEFCMAHRDLIVEVRDHDSLVAFNEEEKLAVDVVDGEWENYLRNSYSLQDDVFKRIQEEESRVSLTSIDEIMDDNQKPCSSSSVNANSSPSLPQSSGSHPVKSSLIRPSINRPVVRIQVPPRPTVRRPFNISTPTQSPVIIRQPFRRIDTPRPVIRTVTPSARIFGSGTIPRPYLPQRSALPQRPSLPQVRNVKPIIIRSMNSPATRPTLSTTATRGVKRELSPEIICLDDENSATPAKVPKNNAKSSSSKRHEHGKK